MEIREGFGQRGNGVEVSLLVVALNMLVLMVQSISVNVVLLAHVMMIPYRNLMN
jgi:hypothetical protein